MKKVILTGGVLMLLSFGIAFAQQEEGENESQNEDKNTKEVKHKKRTKDDLLFEFGLNNYLTNGVFPDNTNEVHTIKPFGSWYFSLGKSYLTKVAGPLFLEWGGNVSWYNFKFQDPATRIEKGTDGITFVNAEMPGITPEKSKLTVSYVNASFVPIIKMGNKKNGIRIGAGVYGGYRLGSYTKLTYETNDFKIKDRSRDNYFANNLRYGVKARFGFRDLNLFANYDLNTLFIEGKGPELNAISAGLVFTDLY
ncbi:MAG: hypothetical protein OEW75_04890 [Cyclobacteriaceae bacterium]|nr:hypothetical protein [Cyclobacteriaceae bacterium]